MKIVHEINQLDFGGVEKVVRNLIKYDKKNEHSIISYRDGAYRQELEKVGANIVLLQNKNDTVDMEADVIHIHTGGGRSELAERLGKNFPIIETIHSPVRSVVDGNCVFQRIGVSKAVAEMNTDCDFIHNGLDMSEIEPTEDANVIRSELGIGHDELVIGRLGRLGRDKGIEEWLLACYELQKMGKEFVPVIVGSASKEDERYVAQLKLMAECLPVKNIKWVGHKPDVMNYLQIMDIFMYPSLTEGFGLVFAEAIMAGCVVAAWETKVTHELFGGYAVLTKPTIKDLVHGVVKLFDPTYRSEFSGMSQDFVRSEYDAQKMSEQYQELYERSV